MSKRKLWKITGQFSQEQLYRPESKVMAYRYIDNDRANWQAGALRSPYRTVWVDERDGRGWQVWERIDLREESG